MEAGGGQKTRVAGDFSDTVCVAIAGAESLSFSSVSKLILRLPTGTRAGRMLGLHVQAHSTRARNPYNYWHLLHPRCCS